MTTLLLDSDIRDWVVLPLFVIMVAAGLLRHYVSVLLKNDPTPIPFIQQRTTSIGRHTSKLKTGNSNYITNWKWHIRRAHYVKLLKDEAESCVKLEEEITKKKEEEMETYRLEQERYEQRLFEIENSDNPSDAANLPPPPKPPSSTSASNPNDPMSQMMNPMSMMKGNMVFMVQNMVMMQGISHFFSGFILLKIPFPLTVGFKPMFQRGLYEMSTLDTSYVSSVSWYFLVMFGLRGFFRLMIGDMTFENKLQNKFQSRVGMLSNVNPGAQPPNVEQQSKNLLQEADNLEYFLQVPNKIRTIDTVEKRLLGSRYPKKAKAYANTTGAGKSSIVSDDFLIKKKRK